MKKATKCLVAFAIILAISLSMVLPGYAASPSTPSAKVPHYHVWTSRTDVKYEGGERTTAYHMVNQYHVVYCVSCKEVSSSVCTSTYPVSHALPCSECHLGY